MKRALKSRWHKVVVYRVGNFSLAEILAGSGTSSSVVFFFMNSIYLGCLVAEEC